MEKYLVSSKSEYIEIANAVNQNKNDCVVEINGIELLRKVQRFIIAVNPNANVVPIVLVGQLAIVNIWVENKRKIVLYDSKMKKEVMEYLGL